MLDGKTRACMWSYVLGIVLAGIAHGAAYSEFDAFSSAAIYCSRHKNAIKLSEDRAILCFDGPITADRDATAFHELKQDGLFVIRSPGGFAPVAIILSNILLEKKATVIVYDYCFSACANYFLIASFKTYVTKNAIVAWHGGSPRIYCGTGDLERIRKSHREAPPTDGSPPPELICKSGELSEAFFKQRGIDDGHIYGPQTAYTKKMVDMAVREATDKRKIFWMWNPRNYGDYFKSRITYESYPSSQHDVDEIISRLGLRMRVFFDPPRL